MTSEPTPQPPPTLIPPAYIDVLLRLVSECVAHPGDIIEVGTYRGGSLFRMAEHVQRHHAGAFQGRRILGIDTFEGHPYADARDPEHHWQGRFADASVDEVRHALASFPFVDVIQGECQEVFAQRPDDQRFCLAHIDVDIAESAERSIRYVYPRLVPGGAMVFDEYQGYGQAAFIDRYFADKPVTLEPRTGHPEKDYGLIVHKQP